MVSILFIAACEGPNYTFQGSEFDTGSVLMTTQPTQYTECELVPQFSFENDEAVEIVVKCEDNTKY